MEGTGPRRDKSGIPRDTQPGVEGLDVKGTCSIAPRCTEDLGLIRKWLKDLKGGVSRSSWQNTSVVNCRYGYLPWAVPFSKFLSESCRESKFCRESFTHALIVGSEKTLNASDECWESGNIFLQKIYPRVG
ncbi:hypothetical protein JTE90_016640 [Oedothorax gibbosus]|uniref:Uncharacterized protein n=1 Tax=Oedothorax gibbosus TaxID=931172 RepID=A0AAV6U5B5_9ARAC|nr:hypothetical protein JTE90_016640 [Oedothorax gibbosus]